MTAIVPKTRTRQGFRYWSRSYAISLLREWDDLTRSGGEEHCRSINLDKLEELMRRVGYVKVRLHEDGCDGLLTQKQLDDIARYRAKKSQRN